MSEQTINLLPDQRLATTSACETCKTGVFPPGSGVESVNQSRTVTSKKGEAR